MRSLDVKSAELTKMDTERLRLLMRHYKIPMNQSMKDLVAERKEHFGGQLPVPEWREGVQERRQPIEWEGPFFCRIINALLESR
jgi:hypothetical protein